MHFLPVQYVLDARKFKYLHKLSMSKCFVLEHLYNNSAAYYLKDLAAKYNVNPWAVYWEGPSAFIRGGGGGEGGGGSKNFFFWEEQWDFDAEYNGEIKIWIRLPVLQQNSD